MEDHTKPMVCSSREELYAQIRNLRQAEKRDLEALQAWKTTSTHIQADLNSAHKLLSGQAGTILDLREQLDTCLGREARIICEADGLQAELKASQRDAEINAQAYLDTKIKLRDSEVMVSSNRIQRNKWESRCLDGQAVLIKVAELTKDWT